MIRKAEQTDIPTIVALALQLWPHDTPAEFIEEFSTLVDDPESAVFLAFDGDTPVGFAQCQLRHDHVEGTDSSPVGYLEGIFVAEFYRKVGYAKLLLAACEMWAKTLGCTEFGSDCELQNEESLRFHLKVGFAEANRIICFTKAL